MGDTSANDKKQQSGNTPENADKKEEERESGDKLDLILKTMTKLTSGQLETTKRLESLANEQLETTKRLESLANEQLETTKRLESLDDKLKGPAAPEEVATELLAKYRLLANDELEDALKKAVADEPRDVLIALSQQLDVDVDKDREVLEFALKYVEKKDKNLWAELFTYASPARTK